MTKSVIVSSRICLDPRPGAIPHDPSPLLSPSPVGLSEHRLCWRFFGQRPGSGRRAAFSGHRAAARHRAAGGAGRRAAVGAGTQRARRAHRAAGRHAVGHLQDLPRQPMALARVVGHEPRPDPQPAPDLSGAGAGAGKDRRPRALAAGAGRHGRARQQRAPEPARARQPARQRCHRLDTAAPDRPVPERGRDLFRRPAAPGTACRRRAGRAMSACTRARSPTCSATWGRPATTGCSANRARCSITTARKCWATSRVLSAPPSS